MSEVVEQATVEAEKAEKKPKVNLTADKADSGHITITVKFPDDHTEAFTFNNEHELYEQFAVHGVGKKIRDTVATIKEPAKQKEAVAALFAAFNEGKWNAYRTGEGVSNVPILARALAALYGKSLDDAQAFVHKLSKKQQSDMRRLPEIAAKINDLLAESTQKGAQESAKNLLAEFAS